MCKTIYINFGKKDRDLIDWANAIPVGRFSIVIKDMIRAYKNKNKTYELPIDSHNENNKNTFRKSVSIGKRDKDIQEYINALEKDGYLIGHEVKKIIRYYIKKQKIDTKPNINNVIDISKFLRGK